MMRSIRRATHSLAWALARLLWLMIALCALSLPLAAQAGSSSLISPEADAVRILDKLAENYYQPTALTAFGAFTFQYTDLPSPFARYAQDMLAQAATGSKRVQILNRNAAAAMDPAFAKEYADFFRETGMGTLLHAKYFLEGKNVRIHLELTDISTRTLVGSADWIVPRASIPSYAPVEPGQDALSRAEELAKLGVEGSGGLQVSLSTDRGIGAAYHKGEKLTALLTVNKDAYVRLYHINGTGKIQLIWPNRFGGGSGFIQAGTTVKIPGPGDPFDFTIEPPYATEFLKAVASSAPFAGAQGDFSDLGTNSSVITRDLRLSGTGPASAQSGKPAAFVDLSEAMAAYSSMP